MSNRTTILGIDAGGATVAIMVAGAVYFGGVLPARSAAEAAAKDREEFATMQGELARTESSLATARQNLQQYTANESATTSPPRTPLDRIHRMGELAQAAGVRLTEVSPGAEQPGKRFNRSPLMLKGLGRSPGFIALLAAIHREFPDTQVVNLTLTGSPTVREADQAFEAELVWYSVARPNAVGNGSNGGAGAKSTSASQNP